MSKNMQPMKPMPQPRQPQGEVFSRREIDGLLTSMKQQEMEHAHQANEFAQLNSLVRLLLDQVDQLGRKNQQLEIELEKATKKEPPKPDK